MKMQKNIWKFSILLAKQNNCDMKVAQIALKNAMAKGDAIVQAQLNL